MTSPSSTPLFIREALDGADSDVLQREAAQVLEACAPMPAPAVPADPGVEVDAGARLLSAVSSGSVRFAPFFDQLMALFQRDEPAIRQLLEDGPWQRTGLRGVRVRDVPLGPGLKGCKGRLTLFDPGTRFPSHSHGGSERVLVILGSFKDTVNGEVCGPGDGQVMAVGTSHSFIVDPSGPCISASVHEQPFVFSSLFLRFLRLFFRS
jgi:quercetin dioxygenase-like cupin family protein